ncbi:MAG: dihydrofolate reductase family protein [Oscillospiraceae bacterium]|nr:dihydrofolate reductase family protein [Oscillospiraceae bacterium]
MKLKEKFGCEVLLLEGGSIINGAFQRADVIDELSLVVAPIVAQKSDKPLFTDSDFSVFELVSAESKDGNVIMNYKRNSEKERIL